MNNTGSVYNVRNTGACAFNRFCSGRALSITYYEFVFVVLRIQGEKRMRHNVICGLSGSSVFFPLYKR